MNTDQRQHTAEPEPGTDLLRQVMAGFVLQGTTLTEWCREHGESRVHARVALLGERNGPKAQALRAKLIDASNGDTKNGR